MPTLNSPWHDSYSSHSQRCIRTIFLILQPHTLALFEKPQLAFAFIIEWFIFMCKWYMLCRRIMSEFIFGISILAIDLICLKKTFDKLLFYLPIHSYEMRIMVFLSINSLYLVLMGQIPENHLRPLLEGSNGQSCYGKCSSHWEVFIPYDHWWAFWIKVHQ